MRHIDWTFIHISSTKRCPTSPATSEPVPSGALNHIVPYLGNPSLLREDLEWLSKGGHLLVSQSLTNSWLNQPTLYRLNWARIGSHFSQGASGRFDFWFAPSVAQRGTCLLSGVGLRRYLISHSCSWKMIYRRVREAIRWKVCFPATPSCLFPFSAR